MSSATLTPELLDRLTRDPLQLASTLPATHPADLAGVLETMQPAVAAHIVAALPTEAAGSVLTQIALRHPERLVEHLGDRFLMPVLHAMSPAALATLLRRTRGSERDRLLALVDDCCRQAVAPLLEYPPDVAAAAMTTGGVGLPDNWTVAEACAHLATLRQSDSAGADVYVLDASERLSHALPMATLLRARREQHLRELSRRAPRVVVAPTLPVREAADVMSHYGLTVVPVVADDGRLLGELRADRALDILSREQTSATRALAAVQASDESYPTSGAASSLRQRTSNALWLLAAEVLAATMLARFAVARDDRATLLLFLPLAIGVAGVLAIQANAMVDHALTSGRLRATRWWAVACHELLVGSLLGALTTLAAVLALLPTMTRAGRIAASGLPHIALVLSVALWTVAVISVLAGAMLPFLIRAVLGRKHRASAPLVSVLVDALGVVVYYAVALALLHAGVR